MGDALAVRELLSDPHVDPAVDENMALEDAHRLGHADVEKRLLASADRARRRG
jgi:hypothetical protein